MEFRKSAQRIIAGMIGAAGLAYPACAAVCPKGRGFCPYPGKCFLYTDADTNSLCDYTTRSAPSGTRPPGTATATTAPVPPAAGSGTSTVPAVAAPPDTTAIELIQQSAAVIGLLLFVILCIALYHLFRSGRLGIRIEKPGPALALSSLISLGIAEIATYLMMGDAAFSSASSFATLYLLAGTVLAAYLWKSGTVTRGIVVALGIISVLFGFALSALIMPAEFIGLAGIITGSQTLALGITAILAALALALVAGRTFCGHVCPVGSIQELAFTLPVKKTEIRHPHLLEGIRLFVFGAVVLAALYAIDLAGLTGAYEFFSLTLSAGFVIFAVLLLVAVVIYRPVCRAICPFGFLFALFAQFSRYRLTRTEACIACKKCEKACPAQVAGRDDPKRECYLCARCTAACPVKGALVYGRRT